MWTPDINRKIACLLPLSDLISLACVNTRWKSLIKDDRFWNLKLKADYGQMGKLEEYKKLYYQNVVKFSELQEKDANILCGFANYECVRFLSLQNMVVFVVENTFEITYWDHIFREMRSSGVYRRESIIAIIKVFQRNRNFPKSNIIFADKHLEKSCKLDFGYSLDGVWIIENVVEYFNKNYNSFYVCDPEIKLAFQPPNPIENILKALYIRAPEIKLSFQSPKSIHNLAYFSAIGFTLGCCYALIRHIYK